MVASEQERKLERTYKPAAEFEQDSRNPLVDLDLTESSQLWLFHWPLHVLPDIHGKEISLKLVDAGHLGNFDGSSGESFDVVSVARQEQDATVFLSSPSGTKIVGQIARRVSIVHYPDPEKLVEQETKKLSKQKMQQTPLRSSSANPTRSSKHTNSSLTREHSSKRHSSGTWSHFSQQGEQSKSAKRERVREPSGGPQIGQLLVQTIQSFHDDRYRDEVTSVCKPSDEERRGN